MAEQFVGKVAEFKDGDRRIISPAQTRSVCSGTRASSTPTAISACTRAVRLRSLTIARSRAALPDKTSQAIYFSETRCISSAPGTATNTT